jgi:hypothetical protein|tara:strand:+ start:2974 stop:3255 length:282 start_codon:yes stop_codon:yes gene_type:complete
MKKIYLTGTGCAPHAGTEGISFQAGEGDKLEFTFIPAGTPGINGLVLYIDNIAKCVVSYSINEYSGTAATYTDASTSKEYNITFTNKDILLST